MKAPKPEPPRTGTPDDVADFIADAMPDAMPDGLPYDRPSDGSSGDGSDTEAEDGEVVLVHNRNGVRVAS